MPRLSSLPASGRSLLPEVAPSHAQAPPTTGDVKLSAYHWPASASRLGEGSRFLKINPTASGLLTSTSEGFEVAESAGLGRA